MKSPATKHKCKADDPQQIGASENCKVAVNHRGEKEAAAEAPDNSCRVCSVSVAVIDGESWL